jgi:hypothetical protein
MSHYSSSAEGPSDLYVKLLVERLARIEATIEVETEFSRQKLDFQIILEINHGCTSHLFSITQFYSD